jgi:hypothetical protein
MKNIFLLIVALCAVTACQQVNSKSYALPIRPESLLDSSAERVSFGVTSPKSLGEVTDWINKDQPTRAELSCSSDQKICKHIRRALSSFAVPYKVVSKNSERNSVVLIYNRIVTRSCDNSFVDNHSNYQNLNHAAFGCSVSANTVQMASDPQQVLNPPLSAMQDAGRAVKLINAYKK